MTKIQIIALCIVLLIFGSCQTYKDEREDAREFADGGEWIIKTTDSDPMPPSGSNETIITTGGQSCPRMGESDGIEIRVGKDTDPKDIGEEAFFILKSHPQYSEFAGLRRGDRVRFEYSEDALQEDCPDGMFIKIKP